MTGFISTALHSAPASLVSLLSPNAVFAHVSLLMIPAYGCMVFAPRSKLTNQVVLSPYFLPSIMIALYGLLLMQAVAGGLLDGGGPLMTLTSTTSSATTASSVASSPLQGLASSFLPNSVAIGALFKSPVLTCLAWTHLLLLDFWQAREVLLDGIERSIVTGHSIVLCFLFGPLGLLSHTLTRTLFAAR